MVLETELTEEEAKALDLNGECQISYGVMGLLFILNRHFAILIIILLIPSFFSIEIISEDNLEAFIAEDQDTKIKCTQKTAQRVSKIIKG